MNHESRKLNPTRLTLNASSGFTLMETLVAIIILSIAIGGPLSLAQKSLSSAAFAHDQVTAFYLAQEAMEFVRNVRDQNNIKKLAWLFGLDSCNKGKICGVDPTYSAEQIKECTAGGCVLNFNSSNGIYSHRSDSDWEPSVFTRTVNISPLENNPKEAVVSVTVSWEAGTFTKSFAIKEHIFDWR